MAFRFRTTSRTPAAIRLSVAGLGDVQIPLVGEPSADIPVIVDLNELNDGNWKQVHLALREQLDRFAAQKQVNAAQARTTWNEDWVVTQWRFGHFAPSPADRNRAEVYEFDGLELAVEN